MRTVSFRRLTWSDDGKTILSRRTRRGTTNRRRPAVRAAEARRRKATRTRARRLPAARARGGVEPDEPAGVDIWHWMDPVVMARQKLSARRIAGGTCSPTWNLDSDKLVPIGKSFTEKVTPIRAHEHCARLRVVRLRDGSLDRPPRGGSLRRRSHDRRADELKDNVNDRFAQVSPGGKYLLFSRTISTGRSTSRRSAITNITKGVADVVHRQGVGRDGQAEAAVRHRRLDERRRGGGAVRQVRHLAGAGRRDEARSG